MLIFLWKGLYMFFFVGNMWVQLKDKEADKVLP